MTEDARHEKGNVDPARDGPWSADTIGDAPAGTDQERSNQASKTEAHRRFAPHPDRASILGEVHARPFDPLPTGRILIDLNFSVTPDALKDHLSWFAHFCRARGATAPDQNARQHLLPVGSGALRWELHTEFVSFLWHAPLNADVLFARSLSDWPFGSEFEAPGPLVSAARLEIHPHKAPLDAMLDRFDPASLSVANMVGGRAIAATDFRQDGDGLTRILLLDKGMSEGEIGTTAQRLTEIDKYRTYALLTLPAARRLQPELSTVEQKLASLSETMRSTGEFKANKLLLGQITDMGAQLEAESTKSGYRFAAGRAYWQIVKTRLDSLSEETIPGYSTWENFLNRRLKPAMATCDATENRMAGLSDKLESASSLLRTRVYLDLEDQNRELLASMDRRARQQLRLQQTVEGLSVAAISYYVIGIVNYAVKGVEQALPIDATLVTGSLAIPAVFGVWWVVRRLRVRHFERDM